MFVIRPNQLALLGGDARARFIRDMCLHLRASFPEATAAFDDEHLERLVDGGLAQAARYGLEGKRQACQFLNLCALHGWDFLKDRGNQWMLDQYLENPAISSPADRITLLADKCVSRLRAEEKNEQTAKDLFPTLDAENDPDDEADDADVPLLEKS